MNNEDGEYEPLEIEVTQDDIDNGIAVDCRQCPVARAARRATGREAIVISRISLFDKGGREAYRAMLPTEARRFINEFDMNYAVEPFKFLCHFYPV